MESSPATMRALRLLGHHVSCNVLAPSDSAERSWLLDLACVAVFGGLAGAAAGVWSGGIQILYVATKVPLLLLGALAIGFPSMVVLGKVLGSPIGIRDGGRLALATIARTAVVLGALSPVTALYALSLPYPDRASYHAIVAVLVLAVAIAGIVGVTALRGLLAPVVPDRAARWRIVALWLGIYSFVGAQVTWLLRPFLATPGLPLEYVRSYGPLGLQSNFYVSMWQIVFG